MSIKYPLACTTDASRHIFCIELAEKLRLWHDTQCAGMSARKAAIWRKLNYLPQEKLTRNDASIYGVSMLATAYWKPVLADAIKAGAVVYPGGLNLTNEGSKLAFLFELHQKLRADGRDIQFDLDVKLVTEEMGSVEASAKNTKYWKPVLGDIT